MIVTENDEILTQGGKLFTGTKKKINNFSVENNETIPKRHKKQ